MTASDVAAGIAASISSDATGRFTAIAGTLNGHSVVTITGPAFTANIGTLAIVTGTGGSVHAFTGVLTATIDGLPPLRLRSGRSGR